MNSRKAVIGIEARSNVRKGVKDAERQLNGLKAPLANIGKLAKMAFAGFGIYTVIRGIKSVAKASAEQEVIFNNLRASIENLGMSYDQVSGSLQKTFRHLQDLTTYGDTDSAKVLTDLITLTNDYQASLKALPLVLDMAASGQFDVRTAARYMAMAMKGNITMLGRYIPELRSSSSAFLSNATEAQKAAYAMKMLRKHFGGRAQAEIKTTGGKYDQLSNEFVDLKEAIGDLINEPLGDFFKVAAISIRGFTKLITPDKPKLLKTNAEAMKAITADLRRYLRELAMGEKLKKDDIEYVMAITGLNWDQAHSVDAVVAAIKKQKELQKTAIEMDKEKLKNRKNGNQDGNIDGDYEEKLKAYQKQQEADRDNYKKIQDSFQNFNNKMLDLRHGVNQQSIDDEKQQTEDELYVIKDGIDRKWQLQDDAFNREMAKRARQNEIRKQKIKQDADEMTAIYATFWQDVGASIGAGEPVLKQALKDSLNMIINYLEKKFLAVEANAVMEALLSGGTLSFTSLAKVAAGYTALEIARAGINTFHAGGIVPGYGNEIPAVLQGGERVISKEIYSERRFEIERAVAGENGNRSPTIINQYNIQAIDTESFRIFMRRKGYKVLDQDSELGYL